jgi:MFS family permease
MLTQAAAIGLVAASTSFTGWATGAVLLGAGTAMVYPTLLAAIGDVAHPAWRARSVGVYRLWRDGGFAVGALLAGVLADAFGMATAIWVVAALTAASGLVVAVRMYETHQRPRAVPAEPGAAPTAPPPGGPPAPPGRPARPGADAPHGVPT